MSVYVMVLIGIVAVVTTVGMLKMVIMPILMARMGVTSVCVRVNAFVSSVKCVAV